MNEVWILFELLKDLEVHKDVIGVFQSREDAYEYQMLRRYGTGDFKIERWEVQ